MTGDGWRADNVRWLRLRLEQLRLRMHDYAGQVRDHESRDPASWWLVADSSAPAATSREGERLADQAAALEATMTQPPALVTTAELAGLSALETELLLLAAGTSYDGGFAIACAELHGDGRRDHPTAQLALQLLVEPADRLPALDVLMPQRPLRRLRLVELADDDDALPLRRLGVDDRVADHLRGVNRTEPRLAPLLRPLHADGDTAYVAAAADRVLDAVEQVPGRWPSVNLTGPADAGAHDTVVRAAEALGLRAAEVDLDRLAATDPDRRMDLLGLLGREALLAGFLYVVSYPPPGDAVCEVVDELVRALAGPLVLLGDQPWPTREPVSVVPLRPVPAGDRRALWHSALDGVPHSVNGEIDAIVGQFDLGPAAIRATVHRASATRGERPVDGPALWRAAREQATQDVDLIADKIHPTYTWDDLVLDDLAIGQLHQLADQVRQRGRVYDDWGFAPHASHGRGISAMFSGASGTGKTMAAEIIAGELGLDLLRVNLAGVVSKFVGETSKNLHRLFDAAQRSGAILLFDEADALFGTRTEVRDSHDRYAVLEINHLLQLMQDYRGLAILATNRRSAVDAAFLRRLRFVVEFGFPGPAERSLIWQRSFPDRADCDDLDLGELSRLEIPGGNIRSIALNAAFLAAAGGHAIGMADVMAAARSEYAKIGRPWSADAGPAWAVSPA